MTDRIEKLEAQVNALAWAWLHLAASLEEAGVVDHERLTTSLRQKRFPDSPLNPEIRETLRWLCDGLDMAYEVRQSQGH